MKSLLSLVAALFFLCCCCVIGIIDATPLDDYVNKQDPNLKWTYTGKTFTSLDYTAYVYNLTSQQWMTSEFSDRSVWWHHVVVIIPSVIDPDYESRALLYITGGDNNNPNSFPDASDEDVFVTATIAVNAKVPAATLFQVPNQPIQYTNDPWHRGGRSEDSAIALTWWTFIQDPSNPEVILELPMTKSAIACMTMLENVIPKYTASNTAIAGFAVAGASKRGWTTWLAGAVSVRNGGKVKVIMPIVLDALHVHEFLHRQFQFYGAWTFALVDYWECNITRLADTPNFAQLMSIVDPYFYIQRYESLPTLVINALGDEFQMPDDWRFWMSGNQAWNTGIKSGIMVKNAEHSLATAVIPVLTSASAFVEGFLGNKRSIPLFTWNISETDGRIYFTTSEPPLKIDISVADSALGVSQGRRDFRWAAINATPCIVKVFGACVRPVLWWTSKDNTPYITHYSPTSFSALVPQAPKNEDGSTRWRGFIVELHFSNPDGIETPYYFTTGASVIPNTLPFPPCVGEDCYGSLV